MYVEWIEFCVMSVPPCPRLLWDGLEKGEMGRDRYKSEDSSLTHHAEEIYINGVQLSKILPSWRYNNLPVDAYAVKINTKARRRTDCVSKLMTSYKAIALAMTFANLSSLSESCFAVSIPSKTFLIPTLTLSLPVISSNFRMARPGSLKTPDCSRI